MKKSFHILLFSNFLVFLFSCTPQQKTETQNVVQTEETIEEVRSLPDYAYTDSLKQGNHNIVYSITSSADDELPEVIDEDGTKYKDNRYNLVITKDGQTLFNRSFTKADFKSQLSKEFQRYGIMDGLRFNQAEEGKLYFNTCISYPESDMFCPFILTIGPDGSYTITPDTSADEDVPPTSEQEASDSE